MPSLFCVAKLVTKGERLLKDVYEVPKNANFVPFACKNDDFTQDRLRTNIGKVLKKWLDVFFLQALRAGKKWSKTLFMVTYDDFGEQASKHNCRNKLRNTLYIYYHYYIYIIIIIVYILHSTLSPYPPLKWTVFSRLFSGGFDDQIPLPDAAPDHSPCLVWNKLHNVSINAPTKCPAPGMKRNVCFCVICM